jgi:hypothetical protein
MQVRESEYPIDHVRDHLAYVLAIAVCDGSGDLEEADEQSGELISDQREAARQYANVLLELYPGDRETEKLS